MHQKMTSIKDVQVFNSLDMAKTFWQVNAVTKTVVGLTLLLILWSKLGYFQTYPTVSQQVYLEVGFYSLDCVTEQKPPEADWLTLEPHTVESEYSEWRFPISQICLKMATSAPLPCRPNESSRKWSMALLILINDPNNNQWRPLNGVVTFIAGDWGGSLWQNDGLTTKKQLYQ